MAEIYISTDIEADGPIPGPHSMLSFASAAYRTDRMLLGTFTANLQLLPGATGHPATMEFWSQHKDAYAATRLNPKDPAVAMMEYVRWIESLKGTPVFVGYPAGFDFVFIYWYLHRFTGASPFGHSALDMKTMGMTLLGKAYRQSVKKNLPAAWIGDAPHTHVALDDAIEQGELFCNMMTAAEKLRSGVR
jgi:hypothetical protein